MAKDKKGPSKVLGEKRRTLVTEKDEKDVKEFTLDDLPSKGELGGVSAFTAKRLGIYNAILERFTDLEAAGEIVCSAVVNPVDASRVALTVDSSTKYLTGGTKLEVLSMLEEEYRVHYKIPKRAYGMLYESLVLSGAHCRLVMSEDIITNFISDQFKIAAKRTKENGESFSDKPINMGTFMASLGIEPTKEKDNLLEFSNDPLLLLGPQTVSLVNEAFEKPDDLQAGMDIDDLFMDIEALNNGKSVEAIQVKASNSVNNGLRPLDKKIPMEAVIPIVNSDDPEEHLDYIILLDENGSPVIHGESEFKTSAVEEDDPYKAQTMSITRGTNETTVSNIMTKAKANTAANEENAPLASFTTKSIRKLVDDKIKDYIKTDGKLTSIPEDEFGELVLSNMLRRVNSAMKTTILYIKKENLVYIASNYHRNGVGKSLLDNLFFNSSMRALLETATMSAEISNNIPRKKYTVKLDDDDMDPKATSKVALDSILSSEGNMLPTGLFNMNDLSKWATTLGIISIFKHPKLPDMEVDLTEFTTSRNVPDSSIISKYEDRAIMSFGLTPSILDDSRQGNFAITEIFRNSMMTRRILRRQEKYELSLTEYCKALNREDGVIKERFKEIVIKDIAYYKRTLKKGNETTLSDDKILEAMYKDFTNKLTIDLPKPETEGDQNIHKYYEDFIRTAKDYLDLRISEDILPEDIYNEFGRKIDDIKDLLLGVLADRWLARNGYLEELTGLFSDIPTGKGTGENVFLEHGVFVNSLEKNFELFLKTEGKRSKKSGKNIEKIKDRLGSDEDDDDEIEKPEPAEKKTPEEVDNDSDEGTETENKDDTKEVEPLED